MILDIIIIAILALSIFLGYKKGLVELSVKLCAVVIAIVATLILYRPVSNIIINSTKLDEDIEQIIINNLSSEKLAEVGELGEQIQNEMLPSVARDLSLNIIRTVVMIVVYIEIKIALRFVKAIANLVAKLPILDQFNKIGGIVFGALRGIIYIYVILLIVSFISQINPNNTIDEEIEKSFITKEMYQHNIIQLLVK